MSSIHKVPSNHRDGRTKRRIRSSSLAAAGVVLYLVLLSGSFQRVQYVPLVDEDITQKELLDAFTVPVLWKHDAFENGSQSQNALRIGRRKNRVNDDRNDRVRTANVVGQSGMGSFSREKTSSSKNDEFTLTMTDDSREKLRFKLDLTQNRQLPLWELSDFAPTWMKEYFDWHQKERQALTEELWHQWKKNATTSILDASATGTKFLVVQCMQSRTDSQTSCGNLMERLGLLPYWLRLAHETNRILFLHWTVPTDLSEFLEPPVGGCDWRAPMWMQQLLLDDQEGVVINNATDISSNSSYFQGFDSDPLLRVQVKHSSDFEDRYNDKSKTAKEPSFQQIFHDLWAIFFVPSEIIRKGIGNALIANQGMKLGRYTSIDLSPINDEREAEAISHSKRVVRFVSKLLPGDPYLVVTDQTNVTLALTEDNDNLSIFARYKTQSNWAKKQGFEDPHELLPQKLIDFDTADFPIHTPEIFHDLFTNFYIMAMGRCVVSYLPTSTLGHATLGRLASLIGYDSNCYCRTTIKQDKTLDTFSEDSFLDYKNQEANYNGMDAPGIRNYFRDSITEDGADTMSHMSLQIKQNHRKGLNSTTFPPWLEEYLNWHRITKNRLTRSNWNANKYLIVGCFETYDNCGGISDRLKPLPMLLWEAYQSQRILLIWWEKPKSLEEWFVPPKYGDGGVDWTVPLFLKEEILKAQPKIRNSKGIHYLDNWKKREKFRMGTSQQRAVVYKIQSPDAGEEHYVEGQILYAKKSSDSNFSDDTLALSPDSIIGSTYQDIFHQLFRRFFTPSPRLAKLLDSKIEQHELVPGEYTAVHLRALYGNRGHRDFKEAIELAVLGANCASNLYPGTPIYFASDMSFAVDAAHAYGKLHGLSIVSLDSDPDLGSTNPIHLDKDPDWKNRSASAYDSTFIDLYLLAESRCVAYSNGGYGLFGSLLSHESECRMRFFKGRKKIKKCAWMNDRFERPRFIAAKGGGCRCRRTSWEWFGDSIRVQVLEDVLYHQIIFK